MIILDIMIVFIGLFGLLYLITRKFTRLPRIQSMYYFTNISAIGTMIYCLNIFKNNYVLLALALYNLIVFIIFNFILIPYGKKIGISVDDIGANKLSSFILHIFLPILFLIKYYIVKVKLDNIYYVLIPLLIYTLFCILRGKYGKPLDENITNYIYPFFDIEKYGKKVILYLIILSVFVLGIGYLLNIL